MAANSTAYSRAAAAAAGVPARAAASAVARPAAAGHTSLSAAQCPSSEPLSQAREAEPACVCVAEGGGKPDRVGLEARAQRCPCMRHSGRWE